MLQQLFFYADFIDLRAIAALEVADLDTLALLHQDAMTVRPRKINYSKKIARISADRYFASRQRKSYFFDRATYSNQPRVHFPPLVSFSCPRAHPKLSK